MVYFSQPLVLRYLLSDEIVHSIKSVSKKVFLLILHLLCYLKSYKESSIIIMFKILSTNPLRILIVFCTGAEFFSCTHCIH